MVTSNATMVKGVQKALENINSVLGAKILGLDSRDEGKLTGCSLSGTGPITTNLRANAIFGVSLTLEGLWPTLPTPCCIGPWRMDVNL